jgi:hypothetical protein
VEGSKVGGGDWGSGFYMHFISLLVIDNPFI